MAAREHEGLSRGTGEGLNVYPSSGSMLLLPVPGSDLPRSYAPSLKAMPLFFAQFTSMTFLWILENVIELFSGKGINIDSNNNSLMSF